MCALPFSALAPVQIEAAQKHVDDMKEQAIASLHGYFNDVRNHLEARELDLTTNVLRITALHQDMLAQQHARVSAQFDAIREAAQNASAAQFAPVCDINDLAVLAALPVVRRLLPPNLARYAQTAGSTVLTLDDFNNDDDDLEITDPDIQPVESESSPIKPTPDTPPHRAPHTPTASTPTASSAQQARTPAGSRTPTAATATTPLPTTSNPTTVLRSDSQQQEEGANAKNADAVVTRVKRLVPSEAPVAASVGTALYTCTSMSAARGDSHYPWDVIVSGS